MGSGLADRRILLGYTVLINSDKPPREGSGQVANLHSLLTSEADALRWIVENGCADHDYKIVEVWHRLTE